MKRFLKILLLSLLVIFLLLQFIPKPEKNNGALDNKNDILITTNAPAEVQNILKKSCYDCHSNNTIYPWYSKIQPVAWWLGNHIRDGKKHLNYSEFGSFRPAKKYKKLQETIKEVKDGEMPLSSYTVIHRDARLTAAEKSDLLNWAASQMDSMKLHYPIDSLSIKK